MSVFTEFHARLVPVEDALNKIASLALFVMMAIITIDTLLRYLFNNPLPGVHTVVELYLMTSVVFLSASALQRNGNNVAVDVLYMRLSDAYQNVVNLAGRLGVLVVFVWIFYETGTEAWQAWVQNSMTTGVIQFPTYLSWIILPVGFAILCLRLVVQISDDLRVAAGGEPVVDTEQDHEGVE